jgi:hypothetical protein
MKPFITALAFIFVLASGTSLMTLTVRADRTHIDQDRPHTAGHQKAPLVY